MTRPTLALAQAGSFSHLYVYGLDRAVVINRGNQPKVALAEANIVEQATEMAATVGKDKMGQMAPHQRQTVMQNIANQAKQRVNPFKMRAPKPIDSFKPVNSPRRKRRAFTENTKPEVDETSPKAAYHSQRKSLAYAKQ
jgi:hypothetical protein